MSIFNHFSHITLSSDQEAALTNLESFIGGEADVFLLKGYAGSGKTTIIKGLIGHLQSLGKQTMLMAPTGRAAKVIRDKTGAEAFTIHKSIYSYEDTEDLEEGDSFRIRYMLRNNLDIVNTIFIVDEASMVSDHYAEQEFFVFGSGHLLSDLMRFARIGQSIAGNKIIFVGDPCQLPPVQENKSKALDLELLQTSYGVTVHEAEMKEVKRQQGTSGVLKAASRLRKSMTSGIFNNFDLRENGTDLFNPLAEQFLDLWQTKVGTKVIVAYKNKTCQALNSRIRERRYGARNLSIREGDIVIIGANDYKLGVFNGEFAVVNWASESVIQRVVIMKKKEPVTLTWREVELLFPDSEDGKKPVKGLMLENFLTGDNYLTSEEMQAIYVDFKQRHPKLYPRTEEFKEAMEVDPFVHCLKLKYGYAVTCHKAQGGEWDHVFSVWDHDYRDSFDWAHEKQSRSGKTNDQFYRWAYTALTRTSKNFYSLNPPYFNAYSSMTFVDFPAEKALNELKGVNQPEELEINEAIIQMLSELGLSDEAIPIQDHLIRVSDAFSKHHIEVVGWQRLGFEIRYKLNREGDSAVFKSFINGKGEFKQPFLPMPGQSANAEFNLEISELFKSMPAITVTRNVVEVVAARLEFEFELEEQYPFVHDLFDDINVRLEETGIIVARLEHMQHKERYTFSKGREEATLDFEYNAKGTFGRVLTIPAKTTSSGLANEIRSILAQLKEE